MTGDEETAWFRARRAEKVFWLSFGGRWTLRDKVPDWSSAVKELQAASEAQELRFAMSEVTRFDSALVAAVMRMVEAAERKGLNVHRDSLPTELRQLLRLAQSVPEKEGAGEDREEKREGVLERLGRSSLGQYGRFREVAEFVGECVLSAARLASGRAQMRWKDFWSVMEEVGLKGLPIVSLISFLMGVIISFLGAVTLRQFGAEFAVAYLVGYGMLREMGAVMTGIILAGRTGAAFAAQLGSMKVNEEIDALRTFGINPYDFLVAPRLLALFLMVPVLTAYANVIGTLSGWLVAEFAMGVPGTIFFEEMNRVVDQGDFFLGIFKACVFGLLIGVAGCLRGLQSGSGADAVGRAATSAVVTGITLIIFSNAVIDWAAAILEV